ncbi:hypothetical protein PIB30_076747 [Stylosanthes scabra]|uniref:Uncharacterized protein n=1 Tax=Stylosanthes scabra TaxID=79078 RepID=A0ABU6TQS2_9FABA|nr:hypothetical protein [Stylosanthes scabra]
MIARKGKEVASASTPSRIRTTKNSSRGRDDGFPTERFDYRIHYDRWKQWRTGASRMNGLSASRIESRISCMTT